MPNFTDDEYAEYNLKSHRYFITEKALTDLKGLDLRKVFLDDPDDDINAFLLRVTIEGYSALLAGVKSRDKTLYALSLPAFREAVLSYLTEVAYSMAISRADPGAFFSNSAGMRTIAPLAMQIAMGEGIYFRGEWSANIVPVGFMSSKGVDW